MGMSYQRCYSTALWPYTRFNFFPGLSLTKSHVFTQFFRGDIPCILVVYLLQAVPLSAGPLLPLSYTSSSVPGSQPSLALPES